MKFSIGIAIVAVVVQTIAGNLVPDTAVYAWFDSFSVDDEELHTNAVSNAKASEWALSSIPRFECPDRDIERTYYFRWWTYRKHLKNTPDGWDWWCIDGVCFHGREITVLFDRYGTRYGKGIGLVVQDGGTDKDKEKKN